MKKILLFIFTIAFGLSSCMVDEPLIDEPYSDAINFRSFVGNSTTKGVVTDLDSLKSSGFTVYAYQTAAQPWADRTLKAPFMHDQMVNWTDGTPGAWGYSPMKYWPNEVPSTTEMGKVTFFALTPIDAESAAGATPDVAGTPAIPAFVEPADAYDAVTGANPSFEFTTHDVCSLQVDLLADMLTDRTKILDGGMVKFEFEHLLSKIGFSAKLDAIYPGTNIEVDTLIVFFNEDAIYRNSTYTFGDGSTPTLGDWGTPDSPVYVAATNEGESVMSNVNPVRLINNDPELPRSQLNENNKFFMLIPQSVSPDDLSIEIRYRTVPTGTGMVAYNVGKIKLPAPPIDGEWKKNKQYTYIFRISLLGVKFEEITVDEWQDGDMNIDITPEKIDKRDDVSNSYIITPDADNVTKLSFPAVTRVNEFWGIGNNAASAQKATYPYGYQDHENAIGADDSWFAEVIWADFDYEESISFKQTFASPGVGIDVPLEMSLNRVKGGNIVIGLRKFIDELPSSYLWSWHIWISDVESRSGGTFISPDGSKIVMDRNLGALSASSASADAFGMLYQWGRKDAFPAPTAEGREPEIYNAAGDVIQYTDKKNSQRATLAGSIAHPATFYGGGNNDWVDASDESDGVFDRWNNSVDVAVYGDKSIFDPCPDGWRIPWGADWSGFTDDNFEWNDNNTIVGRRFTIGASAGFFPAAGRRGSTDGNFDEVGTNGFYWSATSSAVATGNMLMFTKDAVTPGANNNRSAGFYVRPVKDLSATSIPVDSDVAANCYIVAPTLATEMTKLTFPAVTRVNEYWSSGVPGIVYPYGHADHSNAISSGDKWYAEVIWADFDYRGKVMFKQNSSSMGQGSEKLEMRLAGVTEQGNIVVGVKKEGVDDYLWSWHIWVTDVKAKSADAIAANQTFTTPSGFKAMDRNLGALAGGQPTEANTDTFGLFYQYGRKDAFPGAGGITESTGESTIWNRLGNSALYADGADFGVKHTTTAPIDEAIAKPLDFYGGNGEWVEVGSKGVGALDRWNVSVDGIVQGTKSIFDPCPEGWRLPYGENWSGFTHNAVADVSKNLVWTAATGTSVAGGKFTPGAGGNGAFFPAAGFRDRRNGVLTNVNISGYAWSGSPESAIFGNYLTFYVDSVSPNSKTSRSAGLTVRPVVDGTAVAPVDPATIVKFDEKANSYMVAPNTDKATKLRFPAIQRSNEYWKTGGGNTGNATTAGNTYPYGFNGHDNSISAEDEWCGEVIWADFAFEGKITVRPLYDLNLLEVEIASTVTTQGNFVVGLKKGNDLSVGDYVWSWHIWITDFKDAAGQTFTTASRRGAVGMPDIGGKTVMDRNLGARSVDKVASSTDTFGMFYQWGRKDAFPPSSDIAGAVSKIYTTASPNTTVDYTGTAYITDGGKSTIEGTMANPMHFYGAAGEWVDGDVGAGRNDLWNVKPVYRNEVSYYDVRHDKSIFDPCPPGWRVPWGQNWTGFTKDVDAATDLVWSTDLLAGGIFTSGGKKFFFPATGYLYHNTGALTLVSHWCGGWSATPSSVTHVYYLRLNASEVNYSRTGTRSHGLVVRPVKDIPSPPAIEVNVTEYAPTQLSNSYILPTKGSNDKTKDRTLRFPAVQRLNEYWKTGNTAVGQNTAYPYGHQDHANSIGDADRWFAEVIWADVPVAGKVAITQNNTTVASLGTGLTLLEMFIDPSITEGNIVVGIKKVTLNGGGDAIESTTGYLWSWHIWVSDVSESDVFNTVTTMSSDGKTVMDRNLGARSGGRNSAGTDAFGLLYQWGRKDAFPGASATSGTTEPTIYNAESSANSGQYGTTGFGEKVLATTTLDASIAAPLTINAKSGEWLGTSASDAGHRALDRWNVLETPSVNVADYNVYGKKSIFDPCPVGWRVPWGIDWSGFTDETFPPSTGGRTFTAAGPDKGWFPTAGLRDTGTGTIAAMSYGAYASASPFNFTNACELQYTEDWVWTNAHGSRDYGFSVRPVRDVTPPASLYVGQQEEDEAANSYIVPHGGTDITKKVTTLHFPAVTRVNEFWGTYNASATTQKTVYPYGFDNHPNAIADGDKWYAEVIWADFDYTSKIAITQKDQASAGITLTDKLEVIITDAPQGNVVIGLKKGAGTAGYLWSWHIWISDIDGRTADVTKNAFAITPTSGAKNVMDRNLGALSNVRVANSTDTFGLIYQWGRKDAFPCSDSATTDSTIEPKIWNTAGLTDGGLYGTADFGTKTSGAATIMVSVANPLNFYGTSGEWVASGPGYQKMDRWGSDDAGAKGGKSLYDPCPPGWRVPWGVDWSGIPSAANGSEPTEPAEFPSTTNPNGRTLIAAGEAKGWFPASGWRSHDGGAFTGIGNVGRYWSASPRNATIGYNLGFSYDVAPSDSNSRSTGCLVRPVQDIP